MLSMHEALFANALDVDLTEQIISHAGLCMVPTMYHTLVMCHGKAY
jgi:hypothetical protein